MNMTLLATSLQLRTVHHTAVSPTAQMVGHTFRTS
jgi:hypothetical protein